MFRWNDKYQWIFSDLGAADKVGVNESGIGIFKRQPYKGLAKEILQNVTDAKDKTILDKGIMPSEKVLDFPVDCNTLTGSVNL